MHGLGLTDDLGTVTLTVRFAGGTSGEATVDAVPSEFRWDRYPPGWVALTDTVSGRLGRSRPLHLRHRELPYWYEYLPAADLVYFQYNAVRDHPAETFAVFCDRLFAFISDRRPTRLVIDMRWNGGGNTFLAQPLLHHLISCPAINRRRRAHRVPAQFHRREHCVRTSLQQGPRERRRPVLADFLARRPPDVDRAGHLHPADLRGIQP